MPVSLPRWPITLFGILFPILWLLGLGFIFLPVVGTCAAVVLIRRRHALLPPGWYFWAAYLVLACASVVEIDTSGRLVGFVMRMGMVLGASAIAVYVYSATPRSLPTSYVYRSMALLWLFIVIGGWLGVLFPDVTLQTPASMIMPESLMSNEFVDALVRPRFAEIQQPFGAEQPFMRPAAPFPGANGWGCNMALLTPMVLRYIATLKGWQRVAMIIFSVSALIPAAQTLDRGLIIGLAVAVLYAAFRSAFRGHWRFAAWTATGVVVSLVGAQALGFTAALSERLATSATNETRGALYQEAIQRTLDSPVLGYGAPRPSLLLDVSVGTQGQIWNVMVSHGFIALACYVAFFVVAGFAGRSAPPIADAGHITVIVGIVLMWFYGLDGPQLAILLLAGAVSVRAVRLRARPYLWPRTEEPSRGSVSAAASSR